MSATDDESDFDRYVRRALAAYEEQLREIGTFNLVVVGDTGVGKSALINAVFGFDEVPTGRGEAQTVELKRWRRTDDDPLTIYDSVGFVTGEGTVEELVARIAATVAETRQGPREGWIHVVWYVHNVLTNRFTDQHAQLVRAVHDLGLPVMMVLTHVARLGDEVSEAAVELRDAIAARELPLAAGGRIFLVNSVETRQLGGPTIPRHGLDELLAATVALVPEAARAIRAVQRLDLSVQRKDAIRVLRRYRRVAVGAGATAAVPLPGVDLLGLGGTLAAMIAKISAVYAVPIDRQQLVKVAAVAVVGVTAAHGATVTVAGSVAKEATRRVMLRQAAREGAKQAAKEGAKQGGKQLARFVPVANVAVGVVGAVSANGLTTAAAHAWMRVCEHLLTHPEALRSVNETGLVDLFRQFYRRKGSEPPAD